MENEFLTTEGADFIDQIVRKTIEHHNDIYLKNIFFTPGKIWNKIKKFPNKKTPHPDKISHAYLKHFDVKVALLHTQIFSSNITSVAARNTSQINGNTQQS